jgi:hypothetical protein
MTARAETNVMGFFMLIFLSCVRPGCPGLGLLSIENVNVNVN